MFQDSDWPLSDSKKLKEKFDKIFNATKYVKAIENIKEIRKGMNKEITEFGADLKVLRNIEEYAIKVCTKKTTKKIIFCCIVGRRY